MTRSKIGFSGRYLNYNRYIFSCSWYFTF